MGTTCWGVSKALDFFQTDPTPGWLLSSAEPRHEAAMYPHMLYFGWHRLNLTEQLLECVLWFYQVGV